MVAVWIIVVANEGFFLRVPGFRTCTSETFLQQSLYFECALLFARCYRLRQQHCYRNADHPHQRLGESERRGCWDARRQARVPWHASGRLPEGHSSAVHFEHNTSQLGPGRAAIRRVARLPFRQAGHVFWSFPFASGWLDDVGLRQWRIVIIPVGEHAKRSDGNLHPDHSRHGYFLVLHYGVDHDDADD